jgi:cytochrome-b5 reductase
MDLIVKKYEGGPMSTYLHNMEPGQRLDIKGPIPKYPWEANKHDHIALLAGGTGITPVSLKQYGEHECRADQLF